MASSPNARLWHRVIALGLLALWTAPGAGALAVSLHLVFGHRHHDAAPHVEDHQAAALEFALAAVHGHVHCAEAVPHHEHSAPVPGGPSVQPSAPPAIDRVPGGSAPQLLAAALERPSSPRRGPPIPLFEAHCSLLL